MRKNDKARLQDYRNQTDEPGYRIEEILRSLVAPLPRGPRLLDSHMTPYGVCEVAQRTARSSAQYEAERFRKGCRCQPSSVCEGSVEKLCPASSGFASCPSSDFECPVPTKHARAAMPSAMWVVFESCRSSNLFGFSKASSGFEKRI